MTQNLKDEYPVCRTCGTLFLYTGGERRHTLAEGKARPDRCPACRSLERLTTRHAGVLERYDRQRGYGFIRDEDGASVFVHASALGLRRGAFPARGIRLCYLVEQDERGPRATAVTIVDSE